MPHGGPGPPSPDTATVILPSKILFGRYEVGRLLGCGAFAKVYHARDLRSGASVAIKCISRLRILSSNLSSAITREVSIMRRLRHPHIVRLIEVLASRTKIFFVLELVRGGELFTRLASHGRLPEHLSRSVFHQLLSAVAFCHRRGVYHRDLKPENILLDDHGNIKVSDFGLSAVARPDAVDDDGKALLLHTVCGTPAYVAPEVLTKKGYHGARVDVWSCGVILFVLNAGYLPFNDSNLMQLYRKIYRGDYRMPRWTSPELRRLISRMLDTNPATRITVDGIIKDPWFRKGLEEEKMRAMMSFDADVEDRMQQLEKKDDINVDRELNAFDIISMSSGLNLSGMFNNGQATERARFVSEGTAEGMIDQVEEVGRGEGMVVRRRRKVGGAAVEGQNGNLVAWVEVHRLSPELVMVEIEKGADVPAKEHVGEERWMSCEFWKERLLPASAPVTPTGRREVPREPDRGTASEPVSPVARRDIEAL